MGLPLGFAVACGALAGACADPVHDDAVSALGPEQAGIPPGEFHRAGQPCVLCHSNEGPAKASFVLGGTVFSGPDKTFGAGGVTVELIDSLGSNFSVTTNCVGNFFVTADVWNPAFPILVQVQNGANVAKMHSQVGREGSCASCHLDKPNYNSPGHVRANATEPANEQPDPSCPVSQTAVIPGPVGGK